MLIITCPHCKEPVFIEQINCAIFRHAVYKTNMEPIPPHSSKEECDRLKEHNLIWGCGKPFRIVNNIAVSCDYI